MNLAHWLHRQHLYQPALPALAEGTTVTYNYWQMAVAAQAGALWLAEQGVKSGDRVGIFKTNHTSYLVQIWSAWWMGAIVVPINERLHGKEAAYILGHSGAKLCLVDPAHEEALGPYLATEPGAAPLCLISSLTPWQPPNARAGAALALPTPCASDHPAWLFYTSGTTGKPKGVTLTHGNLMHMALAYTATVQAVDPSERFIHPAPLSHGSGLYHLPYVMNGGLNIVPASGGLDCAEVFELAAHWGHVSSFAAPTIIKRLAAHAQSHGLAVSGFSTLVVGGAPLYLADLEQAQASLGPVLAQIYGQGESPMTITVVPKWVLNDKGHPEWAQRAASVGFAQPNVEVAVLLQDGSAAAAGSMGEVCVRGEVVMTGYWSNDKATREAIKDGWLWTGDLGRLDANGFLTLLDRSKDLVISGGNNIYPREIEEVLLQHPMVAEVSVIGRPDREWGESLVAYVVLAPVDQAPGVQDAGPEQVLDAYCLAHMARYKRPKAYRVVKALPKNNYGKVLKTMLRDWEAAHL